MTQEMWVQSLGREDAMKEEMTTNSSIFAWKIPWTEESGGLQSKGSLRVGHDWEGAQKYLIASDALQIVKLWETLSNTLMLYLIGKCAFINWEG